MFRKAAKNICPPIIWNSLKYLFGFDREPEPANELPEYEYMPDGWDTELPEGTGWDVADIVKINRTRCDDLQKLVNTTAPLQADPNFRGVSLYSHNQVMALGYVLARTTLETGGRVSILDWGGSTGYYSILCKALLPGVELDYHCVETPEHVRCGREIFNDITFYDDNSWQEKSFDLVMSNCSFIYVKDWAPLLGLLAKTTGKYLYLSSIPIVSSSPGYVCLQRAYKYGYNSEYLGWTLNRREVVSEAERSGVKLEREFFYSGTLDIAGAREKPEISGFLFSRP